MTKPIHWKPSLRDPAYRDDLAASTLNVKRKVVSMTVRVFVDPDSGVTIFEGFVMGRMALVEAAKNPSLERIKRVVRRMKKELRVLKLEKTKPEEVKRHRAEIVKRAKVATFRKTMGYRPNQGYGRT